MFVAIITNGTNLLRVNFTIYIDISQCNVSYKSQSVAERFKTPQG